MSGESQNYGIITPKYRKEARDNDPELVVDDSSSDTSSEDGQAGVKAIEAVSKTWTIWSLACPYTGYATNSTVWKCGWMVD